MTDDQKQIVADIIRNTIDFLHKQEVLLIQLLGSVEMTMGKPREKTKEEYAAEVEKFMEILVKRNKDVLDKPYQFPWGVCEKKDEKGPGLTRIIAKTPNGVVIETPCAGVILDDLPKGVFNGDPRKETPNAHD